MKIGFLKTKKESGYVALISIIIIVALLMVITVAVSFSGFFSRFGILDNELKEISVGLADACGDAAILKLAENWNWTPPINGETVIVGTDDCKIISVQTSGSEKTIRTQAIFQNSYTNLEITIQKPLDEISIVSWNELANF